MQCIDDNTFLEYRLDTQIGTTYPHTPLKTWNITMTNLARRKHGNEAKCLLSILACCSQKEDLKVQRLKVMYDAKDSAFEIFFVPVTKCS